MKLSTRTQYAIQALSYMVRHYEPDVYVRIESIADEEKLSRKFLEQVITALRDAEIVDSKRGRHGGCRLAKAPAELSLGQAIRAVEGRLTPLPAWVSAGGDGLGGVLLRVRYAVREILDNCSLEVLAQQPSGQTLEGLDDLL